MTKTVFQTLRKERSGYYSYFFGQNIIYTFVTLFMSVYYITTLGIPPAVVGTILLVARVWDAINDPMLSVFVEKANLKGGKFKPWVRAVAILIPILTVLLFSFSNILSTMSLGARVAYATVTYIIWGMTYTISDAPAFALATVMTSDVDERNHLISFQRIATLLGVMVSMIVAPILVDRMGGNWFVVSLILCVVALICLLGVNWTTERIKSAQSSPTLKQILAAIFQNRYLVIIVLTIVLMNGFSFGMTITPLLAEYVFGDAALSSIILGMALIPILITAPFVPRLCRKFGKNTLLKFALVVNIVFSLIIYFTAEGNLTLFLVLLVIRGTLTSYILIISTLYFADAIEYDYYKKGTRFEAAVFSAQTFSSKATGAIAGAGAMYLISIFGFKESLANETVVQTAEAINGIWITYNLGPIVGATIALIVFTLKYDLTEKKLKQMGIESGRLKAND